MQYIKTSKGYVVRLELGEEIHESLTDFCKKENITSGNFNGIGAVTSADLGFYNLEKKEYTFKIFDMPLEIVSLNGNVAMIDGEPFMHIHTVLSDTDYSTYGGHLKRGVVGATCEIFLYDTDTDIERKMVSEIGLKLLDLK